MIILIQPKQFSFLYNPISIKLSENDVKFRKFTYKVTISNSKRLNWLFYNSTLTTLSINNYNNTLIEYDNLAFSTSYF